MIQMRRLPCRGKMRRPKGIATIELILAMPVLLAILAAIVEAAMLCAAAQRVQLACSAACRVGTRPCPDVLTLDELVRSTARDALVSASLVEQHQLKFTPGESTGDRVVVEISVPMRAASPDLLAVCGFGLKDRFLVSRMVMRRE